MKFTERISFILLVAGIVFFAVGVAMVIAGISAEGLLDLKSAVVSGTLKTGSAGLFVLFFAFMMIVLAIMPARNFEIDVAPRRKFPNNGNRGLLLFFALLTIAIAAAIAAGRVGGDTASLLIAVMVASGVAASFVLLFVLITWDIERVESVQGVSRAKKNGEDAKR